MTLFDFIEFLEIVSNDFKICILKDKNFLIASVNSINSLKNIKEKSNEILSLIDFKEKFKNQNLNFKLEIISIHNEEKLIFDKVGILNKDFIKILEDVLKKNDVSISEKIISLINKDFYFNPVKNTGILKNYKNIFQQLLKHDIKDLPQNITNNFWDIIYFSEDKEKTRELFNIYYKKLFEEQKKDPKKFYGKSFDMCLSTNFKDEYDFVMNCLYLNFFPFKQRFNDDIYKYGNYETPFSEGAYNQQNYETIKEFIEEKIKELKIKEEIQNSLVYKVKIPLLDVFGPNKMFQNKEVLDSIKSKLVNLSTQDMNWSKLYIHNKYLNIDIYCDNKIEEEKLFKATISALKVFENINERLPTETWNTLIEKAKINFSLTLNSTINDKNERTYKI